MYMITRYKSLSRGALKLFLDLLVDEDAEQHADEGQQVHFQREAQADFQQPEIDRKRRGDAEVQGLREDVLDDSGTEDRAEGFSEQTAEQAADDDAGDQDPGRFAHARTL